MADFVNLKTRSHFSLLDSTSKASDIVRRCSDLDYGSIALTDNSTISGAVEFTAAAKEAGIKPLLGMSAVVSAENANTQTIIAKNLAGWNKLIRIVNRSNDLDHYINIPRVSTGLLEEYCSADFITILGGEGSLLETLIYKDKNAAATYVDKMIGIFGKDNVFITLNAVCERNKDIISTLRSIAATHGVKCVASGDAHYCSKEDANDHRLLVCSALKKTLPELKREIQLGVNYGQSHYFRDELYHIPSITELIQAGNTEEEIANTKLISDMCESYSIGRRPSLPKFDCPDGISEKEYVRNLCAEGYRALCKNVDRNVYGERVKKELAVINEANLDGYFLIVRDYIKWAQSQGIMVGPGRGSCSGSTVSYLMGISTVDPIPYDLLFERFYNAGRNTKDKVSYPDIDVDFEVHKRDDVISYIRKKYGEERVAHIVTYGRYQGKGALKEVLRINDACSMEEINNITKILPDEAKIVDKLEEEEESSIVRWCLKNIPGELSEWCFYDENGKLGGEYAQYFEQAIRLEGTYKSRGKHASGIIISSDSLEETCPMVYDKKSEQKLAAMDMSDLEYLGFVKFDVLGLLALDRLSGVKSLLKHGKIV